VLRPLPSFGTVRATYGGVAPARDRDAVDAPAQHADQLCPEVVRHRPRGDAPCRRASSPSNISASARLNTSSSRWR
jgi:hypothetical protein